MRSRRLSLNVSENLISCISGPDRARKMSHWTVSIVAWLIYKITDFIALSWENSVKDWAHKKNTECDRFDDGMRIQLRFDVSQEGKREKRRVELHTDALRSSCVHWIMSENARRLIFLSYHSSACRCQPKKEKYFQCCRVAPLCAVCSSNKMTTWKITFRSPWARFLRCLLF